MWRADRAEESVPVDPDASQQLLGPFGCWDAFKGRVGAAPPPGPSKRIRTDQRSSSIPRRYNFPTVCALNPIHEAGSTASGTQPLLVRVPFQQCELALSQSTDEDTSCRGSLGLREFYFFSLARATASARTKATRAILDGSGTGAAAGTVMSRAQLAVSALQLFESKQV